MLKIDTLHSYCFLNYIDFKTINLCDLGNLNFKTNILNSKMEF